MTEARQPEQVHRRRTRRLWRLAFVGFVVALETATHWPRLNMGRAGEADKSAHLLAFGLLVVLLWKTDWFARLGVVLLIGMAWSVVNEWTQALPGLGRSVTWQDVVANICGVLLATSWLWALRPVGGTGNRLRLARQRFVLDEIAAQPLAWVIFGGVTVACVLPLVLLWPMVTSVTIEGPMAFAAVVWGLAMGMIWREVWRRHHRAAVAERACFACGASCREVSFDELGRGTCPRCGGAVNVGQWIEHPRPPLRVMLRLGVKPMAVGLVLIGALFGLIVVIVQVYDRLLLAGMLPAGAPRLVRIMGQERILMRAVDLTAIFITFAIAARLFRHGLARYYDQPFTCRTCGHDLRGTPTSGGLGRCGECGQEFARAEEMAGAGYDTDDA